MKKNTVRSIFISGLLAIILMGVLIAYFAVVSALPSQIYTDEQQEYLSYNYGRSVSQKAPVLNVVQTNQQIDTNTIVLPVQDSRVRATLAAQYQEQENVSVTVYDLDFYGQYQLTYTDPATATIELFFPFPGNLETLHDVVFLVDNQEPDTVQYTTHGINWQTELANGQSHNIVISYKADGANSFSYSLPHNQRANVDIEIVVSGLQGSEVPRKSLPITNLETDTQGEVFTWDYTGLIADRDVYLTLPTQLSFAQRVAQLQDDFMILAGLAPFLIGLFLLVLFGVFKLSNIQLRAEGYLLIGCALALFFPLLTFLSGLLNTTLAAILTFVLISGLLLLFLGMLVGWRKSWWRVGLLLIVFLGIFSLGMLTPMRGILLTIGGLLLVAIFMILYAQRPTPPEPEVIEAPPVVPPTEDLVSTPEPEEEETIAPEVDTPSVHCPHCGRALADDHNFCPGCGNDTSQLHSCQSCGHEQVVSPDVEKIYCVNCGEQLR